MNSELFSLEGEVAIVTGGSLGLGKEMAVALAEAGASVAVADIQDTSDTEDLITKAGQKAIGLQVDVSKASDVEAMVRKVMDEFGHIDILINNAGIFRPSPAEEITRDDWYKVIDVNINGQFLCAQTVGRQMLKQGSGNIINISSIAGLMAFRGALSYNTTKAGLIMMTKSLADEWGPSIRVNAICPGVFATDMTDDMLHDEEFIKNLKEKVPLKRHATADEIAGTVVYLASKASSYMTGHALVIDGGWTAAL